LLRKNHFSGLTKNLPKKIQNKQYKKKLKLSNNDFYLISDVDRGNMNTTHYSKK